MKKKKRSVLLAACTLLITYIAFNWLRNITDNFIYFQDYSVTIRGEGAIYMKYTDSSGDTIEKTVCGYTESLSGNSRPLIMIK